MSSEQAATDEKATMMGDEVRVGDLRERLTAIDATVWEVKYAAEHARALRSLAGVAIARLEAAERVVEAARAYRGADDGVREALAAYAHEAWSGWMRYMLGIFDAGEGPFGTVEQYVERWRRQMAAEYDELPEDEKESDRREADRMLVIMRPLTARAEAAERERDALQQAVIAYCTTRYSATYDTLGKVLLEQGVKLPYWDALAHPAPSSKEDA